ncbi:MAG: hypothetical protein GY929_08605 [Actinomycetia bacterium]|nr:hypothetical protein [Actinomycetes bacterium]
MSALLVVLMATVAAAFVGLIRVVMGARDLEWDQWNIARAVASDQHLLQAGPPTYAGQQYTALVRELEGHMEGRSIIDSRSGVVDLTRLERRPSAPLVDDLIARDLQAQLRELRAEVVESQLARQATLSRCWLVYGDCDATLLGGARVERHGVRVVNLEDPSIQLHLTIRTLSVGLGLGGERSETAALLAGVVPHDVPAAVERMLAGPGRRGVVPVVRLGMRITGLLRIRRAPALAQGRLRHRILVADPTAPADRALIRDVRAHLADQGAVPEEGSWCRIGGPALEVGVFCRVRSTVAVTARSTHWGSMTLDRPGARQVPTVS